MDKRVFKVLLIDDAFFIRNLIKRAITTKPNDLDYTFEVIGEAKNGKEGIVEYFKLKPDFITLDLNMPDINGVEVLKQIKSKDPNVKVIVISGNEDASLREEIVNLGAWLYVDKPFQNAFLWEKMDKMVQLIVEEESNFPSSRSEEELVEEVVGETLIANDQSSSQNIIIMSDEEDDDLFVLKNNLHEPKEKPIVEEVKEDLIEIEEPVVINPGLTFSADIEFDIDKELPAHSTQVIKVKECLDIELPDIEDKVRQDSTNEINIEDNDTEIILLDEDISSCSEENIIPTIYFSNQTENVETISENEKSKHIIGNKDLIIVEDSTEVVEDISDNDACILLKESSEPVILVEGTDTSGKVEVEVNAVHIEPKPFEEVQSDIEPTKATEMEYKENNDNYNTLNSNNNETSTEVKIKKGEVSIAPPRSNILKKIYSETPGFELMDAEEEIEIETVTVGNENSSKQKGLFSSIKNLFNKK